MFPVDEKADRSECRLPCREDKKRGRHFQPRQPQWAEILRQTEATEGRHRTGSFRGGGRRAHAVERLRLEAQVQPARAPALQRRQRNSEGGRTGARQPRPAALMSSAAACAGSPQRLAAHFASTCVPLAQSMSSVRTALKLLRSVLRPATRWMWAGPSIKGSGSVLSLLMSTRRSRMHTCGIEDRVSVVRRWRCPPGAVRTSAGQKWWSGRGALRLPHHITVCSEDLHNLREGAAGVPAQRKAEPSRHLEIPAPSAGTTANRQRAPREDLVSSNDQVDRHLRKPRAAPEQEAAEARRERAG